MVEDRKRVWVLGAGFSRSLGGPLLPELLSQRMRRKLETRFHDLKDVYASPEADGVYGLYHYGREYPEGPLYWDDSTNHARGVALWTDAEHFVDYLHTAALRPKPPHDLELLWTQAPTKWKGEMPKPETLARAAQRILAAECNFVHDRSIHLECWEPYKSWVSTLSELDTIITFNYDIVVEHVSVDQFLKGLAPKVTVIRPAHVSEDLGEAKEHSRPVLLKLHGSVNWEAVKTDGNVTFVSAKTNKHVLARGAEHSVGIAVPGPAKADATNGALATLWSLAEGSLKEADEVIFIGYRFPPSDAEARGRLLRAIAANKPSPDASGRVGLKSPRYKLEVATVLGDNSEAAQRLRHLLEYALSSRLAWEDRSEPIPQGGRYELRTVPLFAEDYLSVLGLG